jgi:GNAT superfamily N-acetyltransferase
MANAKIDIVGKGDLPLISRLYSQVFKPPHEVAFFERRFLGRHNPLIMVAVLDETPFGFLLGFELKPDVFFIWLIGVSPDVRRKGVGSQLVEACEAWASHEGYEWIRFECQNTVRPMLHMAIAHGYDIVGLRWDPDLSTNLVIFQKPLSGE